MIALKDKIKIYTKDGIINLQGKEGWTILERLKTNYFTIDDNVKIYVKYKYHFKWIRLYSIFDLY